MREKKTCKCGLSIIIEPGLKRVSHEHPQCAWFTQLLRQNPPQRSTMSYERADGSLEEFSPVETDGSPKGGKS